MKAIEKSCIDGHWAGAQYLELLGPDAGGLLERDEEVLMNREHLLDLKLRGYHPKGTGPKQKEAARRAAKRARREEKEKEETRTKRRRIE